MADSLLYPRVMVTSTTTGTGTYTLGSAVTGYQVVPAAADGKVFPYAAWEVDGNGNPSGGWEEGLGTYTNSGTTLARTTVLNSSNSGSAVSWSAGTRRVALVLPASFADKYLHPTNTYANLAAVQAGRVLFPSDGHAIYRDTGSLLAPWGPVFPMTEPIDGNYSWVNQGTATVSVTGGGILLQDAENATDVTCRLRVKASPATPYTITAAWVSATYQSNAQSAFLLFRESSSGKFVRAGVVGTTVGIAKMTDPNTLSAVYTTEIGTSFSSLAFLRIADDGVNRIVSISPDGGLTWYRKHTVIRTDFITADQVGFGIDCGDGGSPSLTLDTTLMRLIHWKEA